MIRAWPDAPPPRLTGECRLMYLASKDALRSDHIVELQRHLYCTHPMAFVLRPVFDMLFDCVISALAAP